MVRPAAERQLRVILFRLAVEHGYCDITSSYEDIEVALQRIADEHFRLRGGVSKLV